MAKKVVIFDLCGVLVKWNPRHAYAKKIPDKNRLEYFMANVCGADFNLSYDEGRSLAKTIAEWQEKFPEYAKEIALYPEIRKDMFLGEIQGTVKIVEELKQKGIKVYLLSNCAHENINLVKEFFPLYHAFDGAVFSGEACAVKPKPEIFNCLFDRYQIPKEEAVFIDDSTVNIERAKELGLDALTFTSPEKLRKDLKKYGLL